MLVLSEKSVGIFFEFPKNPWVIFFEFLMQQSPMFECVLHDDGGLSKAHIARHSSPTLLVHVITSVVANHAPSVPILNQFPSGSMSLLFQLSDKTLKSSNGLFENKYFMKTDKTSDFSLSFSRPSLELLHPKNC